MQACPFHRGVFAVPVDRIVVYAQGGDDWVTAIGTVPAFMYGGAGDDRLDLGNGSGVAVGDDGDDTITGGHGRDVLIGGRGADRIVGNAGDDVLIAGYTAHDGDEQALSVILSQWSTLDAYAARVSSLRAGLLGTAYVFDDSTEDELTLAGDTLTGSSGEDWFLYNLSGTGPRDRRHGRSRRRDADGHLSGLRRITGRTSGWRLTGVR